MSSSRPGPYPHPVHPLPPSLCVTRCLWLHRCVDGRPETSTGRGRGTGRGGSGPSPQPPQGHERLSLLGVEWMGHEWFRIFLVRRGGASGEAGPPLRLRSRDPVRWRRNRERRPRSPVGGGGGGRWVVREQCKSTDGPCKRKWGLLEGGTDERETHDSPHKEFPPRVLVNGSYGRETRFTGLQFTKFFIRCGRTFGGRVIVSVPRLCGT